MINLGASIQSNNSNMTTLLRRTWGKIDDGNGPDGVYRSHIVSFGSPSVVAIFPINNTEKMQVQKIEVAFGVSSWNGNTSPSNFAIQYTDDHTASYNDPRTDSRWETVKSYTSWSHKSGIVNINVDFSCWKIRIYTSSAYQGTYYRSTVFRIYGKIIATEKFLVQSGENLMTFKDDTWSITDSTSPTRALFDLHGLGSLSVFDRATRLKEDTMTLTNITFDSGNTFRKMVSLNDYLDIDNIDIIDSKNHPFTKVEQKK